MGTEETKEEREEEHEEEHEEEEEKSKPKSTRQRSDDPPAPTETPTVKCPECRVSVDADDLGSHRYLAHKVERRKGGKREDGDDNGDTGPRTPKRKTSDSSSSDDKAPKTERKQSGGRWAKVRSGWG
jgi:hypothetical protein